MEFNLIKSHPSEYRTIIRAYDYVLNRSVDARYRSTRDADAATNETISTNPYSFTLPLPDQFGESNAAQWDDKSMPRLGNAIQAFNEIRSRNFVDAAQAVMGGIVGVLDEFKALEITEEAKDAASVITKSVMNPRKQMVYTAPKNREFTFSWTLSPRSADEGDEIQRSLQALRRCVSPSTSTVADSAILKYPKEFRVQFKQLKQNDKPVVMTGLPIILPSVVTMFDIDYGENSNGGAVSFFRDGTPTKFVVRMAFREKDIVVSSSEVDTAIAGGEIGRGISAEDTSIYSNMFGGR